MKTGYRAVEKGLCLAHCRKKDILDNFITMTTFAPWSGTKAWNFRCLSPGSKQTARS